MKNVKNYDFETDLKGKNYCNITSDVNIINNFTVKLIHDDINDFTKFIHDNIKNIIKVKYYKDEEGKVIILELKLFEAIPNIDTNTKDTGIVFYLIFGSEYNSKALKDSEGEYNIILTDKDNFVKIEGNTLEKFKDDNNTLIINPSLKKSGEIDSYRNEYLLNSNRLYMVRNKIDDEKLIFPKVCVLFSLVQGYIWIYEKLINALVNVNYKNFKDFIEKIKTPRKNSYYKINKIQEIYMFSIYFNNKYYFRKNIIKLSRGEFSCLFNELMTYYDIEFLYDKSISQIKQIAEFFERQFQKNINKKINTLTLLFSGFGIVLAALQVFSNWNELMQFLKNLFLW